MEDILEEAKVTTIKKDITKPLANEHDAKATRLEIIDINDEDGVVTCKLYEDDKLIEDRRVIAIIALPCDDITKEEREILYPPEVEE